MKRFINKFKVSLLVTTISIVSLSANATTSYQFTDLGNNISVAAVNNLNQIVANDTNNQVLLLNYINNQYNTETLGSGIGIAINDAGQVVSNNMLWSNVDGTYSSINIAGDIKDINNNGQVLTANSIWKNGSISSVWGPYQDESIPSFDNRTGPFKNRVENAVALNDDGVVLGKEEILILSSLDSPFQYGKSYTVTVSPREAGNSQPISKVTENLYRTAGWKYGDPEIETGEFLSDINNSGYYIGHELRPGASSSSPKGPISSQNRMAFLRNTNGNSTGAFLDELSNTLPDYLSSEIIDGPYNGLIGPYTFSSTNALNDNNQVVGYSGWDFNCTPFDGCETKAQHAVLWDGESVLDLNVLSDAFDSGFVLTEALDINEDGIIIGTARNLSTGLTHSFLLSPVPEPEMAWLFVLGLGLMSFYRQNKIK